MIVGLGPSGPQVVEGWHGVPYGKPLTRTREYIHIMREIFRREEPVTFDGVEYQVPFRGRAGYFQAPDTGQFDAGRQFMQLVARIGAFHGKQVSPRHHHG